MVRGCATRCDNPTGAVASASFSRAPASVRTGMLSAPPRSTSWQMCLSARTAVPRCGLPTSSTQPTFRGTAPFLDERKNLCTQLTALLAAVSTSWRNDGGGWDLSRK